MIINLRGANGAGKSTVVTRIMELYATKQPQLVDGRRQPLLYDLSHESHRPLAVLGHYEIACGGCDTIKTVDEVFRLVYDYDSLGYDVLFEGIMVQDDRTRMIKLKNHVGRENVLVIGLKTDIEECLAAVRKRREERGNEKPLDEKNTRDRAKRVTRTLDFLADNGVPVKRLDREAAYLMVKEVLGWS